MTRRQIKELEVARKHIHNLEYSITYTDRVCLLSALRKLLEEEEKYYYAEHNIGFTIDKYYERMGII